MASTLARGGGLVGFGEGELDHLALAHLARAVEAEPARAPSMALPSGSRTPGFSVM